MRKKTVLTALCICALLCSGCEKTPENVIVREKGSGSIQKYESTEAREGSLAKQLGVPKHYSSRDSYEDGRLVIDTDADIFVPDVTDVHTYAVTQKKVTQKMVDDVTEVFFPEAKFYSADSGYSYTKEYYQKKITELKKYRAEGNLDPYGYGKDENGAYRFDLDRQIFVYEENVKEAPKESELKEVTPKLPSGKEEEDTLFMGNARTEDGVFDYVISYSPYFMTGIDFRINKVRDDGRGGVYDDNGEFLMDEEDFSDGKRRWSEDEVKKFVRISYEEAEEKAQEKAEALGMNLALYGWDYKLWYRDENAEIRENNILDGGYIFYFTREVDGIPITYTNTSGGCVEGDIETATTIPWTYEWCDITVAGDGTVCEAQISNPYEIGEMQTEHVKLMDFDNVIKIYEQMMEISGAGSIADWETLRTYHIRKIAFGYARIYNPEADSASGLLVPVWDFFGEFDSTADNGTEKKSGEHSTRSMLTINAIDGSLIDRELGY